MLKFENKINILFFIIFSVLNSTKLINNYK